VLVSDRPKNWLELQAELERPRQAGEVPRTKEEAEGLARKLFAPPALPSRMVDDLLAFVRDQERKHPTVPRFDESTLPPRDFEIVPGEGPSSAESAWTRACFAIVEAHAREVQRLGENTTPAPGGDA
jgi:hypothetical protein